MMAIVGWKLSEADRTRLLDRFPPHWPDVIADHITFGQAEGGAMPTVNRAQIIGCIDDGEGLQALVVALDGSSDRPDGSTYHITWSLDRSRGRHAVDSNTVLAAYGWEPLAEPVTIRLDPACWSG